MNDGNSVLPVDFDDYNFRVSYQVEKQFNETDEIIQNILEKWKTTKKIFRHIMRYEFVNPAFPFLIHLSIVKTSNTNKFNKLIPVFNIKDSNVFNNIEHFEIEIEINNVDLLNNPKIATSINLYNLLKKTIKYVLIGLQQTNYPISIIQQNNVISNYLKLVKNDKKYDKKVNVNDFIGPSTNTLQMINLLNDIDINDTNSSIPNIRQNYTVTEKADGLRKLLYVDLDGKIYLISTSMNVEFTGCFTEITELFNSLIDGEHILHNKNNEFINLYAAFDIYYINGNDKCGYPFVNLNKEEKKEEKEEKEIKKDKLFRFVLLNTFIKNIKMKSVIDKNKPSLKIKIKIFKAFNIFKGCNDILTDIDNGLYEYNTDGLIFTPANTGVASNKIGISAPKYKITWNESFKWKPPEFNTIDFLIKFQKNEYGNYNINKKYIDGIDLTTNIQTTSYYTIILHVGFNPKKHGYINPFNDVINNNIIKKKDMEDYNEEYKPARFYPTNPSDENAGICHIIGKFDESDNLKIFAEDGDEIEDNTIVEFKYDASKPEFWRWLPIRVRHDKTSELRAGIKNFGNAYHVANSNWQSIHKPISREIITTGNGVIVENIDDDIYYNKVSNVSETRSLRDFHNLYVKSLLLSEFSKIGYTLIDYACGKGGDIPKWISSNYEFVLGIDLSKDNIENKIDGACARYLNYAKKFDNIPKAIFLNGNTSSNIKSGEAFYTDKSKSIIKALFGEGNKNEVVLGKAVYNNFGIIKNGFNISSIQFAFHYMFENSIILNNFLKNLVQCTAVEGYFIGTCYDGTKIFKLLQNMELNESTSLFKNDKKIWQITKKYSFDVFNDDETSLGYGIDVYQETINKTFREYLVNFNYLKRIMENYGFILLNKDELVNINLPSSIGSFNDLYNQMNIDIQKDKSFNNKIGSANNMSSEEKQISFLNNYFVFKKIRNVNLNEINNKNNIDLKIYDEKMEDIDNQIKEMEKTTIEEKSKKLAKKFLEQESLEQIDNSLSNKEKISLSIDEKIKLADKKKKEKELLKKQEKQDKLEKQEKLSLSIDEKIKLAEKKEKELLKKQEKKKK